MSIRSFTRTLTCAQLIHHCWALLHSACSASRTTLADPASDISTFTENRRWFSLRFGNGSGFEHLKGVSDVVSGYSGGSAATADYEVVVLRTGHAEAVKITYDPSQISYGQLQDLLFGGA